MALDTHSTEERLSPEVRRRRLRAFADRMLLRAEALDDPEDMQGVERAVRVASARYADTATHRATVSVA